VIDVAGVVNEHLEHGHPSRGHGGIVAAQSGHLEGVVGRNDDDGLRDEGHGEKKESNCTHDQGPLGQFADIVQGRGVVQAQEEHQQREEEPAVVQHRDQDQGYEGRISQVLGLIPQQAAGHVPAVELAHW